MILEVLVIKIVKNDFEAMHASCMLRIKTWSRMNFSNIVV
jgi:hypothetical protein